MDVNKRVSTSSPQENALPSESKGSAFPSTQWSLVLRAGTPTNTEARTALESLCRAYWYPLYTFIRRQGRGHHEAEDCAQDFLAHLLADHGLQKARPERGRFRTFLLSSLRNFLTSEWRRSQAVKRGSGQPLLSLAVPDSNERFCHEPVDTALTPEQAFDRAWALEMIDRAIAELREEYRKSGREKVFEALAPLIWNQSPSDSFAASAAQLGLSVQTFTVALHRARRRLGERLRLSVAETVLDPAEIDTELRHLISAISTQSPRG